MRSTGRLITVGLAAAALAFVDDKVKKAVEDGKINNSVIKPNRLFKIEEHHNKGFAGNRLEDKRHIVLSVSSFAAAVQLLITGYIALSSESALFNTAGTLMLAGAISNTKDRIFRKYVVDYIRIKDRIYNLSDFYLFSGALLVLLYAAGNAFRE